METTRRDTRVTTLRDHLRAATSYSHHALDTSMRPASDWRCPRDYARFLKSQYNARVSVECWLSMFAPAQLKPPEQTPFLARDLFQLGEKFSLDHQPFDLDYRSEATAIGVAWVLAGSSLGNRAMMGDMARVLGEGATWPHQFLGNHGMTIFWKALRTRINARIDEAEATEATRAATQVFEHFLSVAKMNALKPDLQPVLEGVQ